MHTPVRLRYPLRPRSSRRLRSGAIVLELILALPVFVVFLLAVIEFGLIFAHLKQVALASRVGAEAASQFAGLSTIGGDPVPADVLNAIDAQLSTSNMAACKVILEHNVPAATVILVSGTCDCNPQAPPPPVYGEYVRVTVCVPLEDLTPDLLATFGFSIAEREVEYTTTFRYEL